MIYLQAMSNGDVTVPPVMNGPVIPEAGQVVAAPTTDGQTAVTPSTEEDYDGDDEHSMYNNLR